jgi:hypothetical protein
MVATLIPSWLAVAISTTLDVENVEDTLLLEEVRARALSPR